MSLFIEEALVAGSELCFIHFSSRNRNAGNFDRYPTGDACSNIFVNCSDNAWYLNGIEGLGAVGASTAALSDKAGAAGAKRIISVGSQWAPGAPPCTRA